MHSGIWSSFQERLSRRFTCHAIDLPGHGDSPCDGGRGLDSWVEAIAAVAPSSANWIGWSLGGLVAQQFALKFPQRVRSLILVASTPRFVTAPDWPCAVTAQSLKQFVDEYEQDFERVLNRFLTMQVGGSRERSATLQRLRARFAEQPAPQPEGLRAGFEILQSADFRDVLPGFPVPVHFLLGQCDLLIPAGIASRLGGLPVALIEGAGHAPFISRADLCAETVERWLSGGDRGSAVAARQ
jgi:pimeloyl-[acyl-carrier protein] methyl ester esterase